PPHLVGATWPLILGFAARYDAQAEAESEPRWVPWQPEPDVSRGGAANDPGSTHRDGGFPISHGSEPAPIDRQLPYHGHCLKREPRLSAVSALPPAIACPSARRLACCGERSQAAFVCALQLRLAKLPAPALGSWPREADDARN